MITEKRSLKDDRRGAILVAAVFMAVFLVGALWYLVGIGDAAIYREKMQDGSDAVAFASAVYHARGMNIIAILNLIMAAALAVLIAFKIAEIVAFTVAAICAVLCPFTGGATCTIATEAANIGNNLHSNIIPKVQQVVDNILKVSSESQRWVARITPWVGAARGVIVATQYSPTVKGGVALSLSMVPMGDRLGLPVQEEPFDKLCERAGKMLGGLAFGWIPGLEYIGGLLGKLAGTFPGYFCGSSGGGGNGGSATADQKQTVKEQCAEAKKAYDEANKDKSGPKKTFDMKKCEDDANKQLEMSGGGKAGSGSVGNTGEKTSKMIFSGARNGNDYFQVYGFVLGDNAAMHQNAKSRVEMASWGKSKIEPNALTDTMEKVGFAEAEFYYDQVKSGKTYWDDYKDEALWNMRWRARLRRFRLPTQVGMDTLGSLIGSVPGIPGSLKVGTGWVTDTAGQINGAVGTVVIH
ncbi:Hypothetical protein A7982_09836 [Minicystis rosea]|nr:Hypothetical protein A7982_09836 [Minicystis rosea]